MKTGRGRPPKRCKDCARERRVLKERERIRQYREIAEEQLHVSVGDELLASAAGMYSGWHMDIGREIPGTRGRRGADEGCSTWNQELAAQLRIKAGEAASDPWWDNNPDALKGLWG